MSTPESAWSDARLFSSRRQDWETPQALFDEVNKEFDFNLDAAATESTAKCIAYITPEQDALSSDWCLRAGRRGAVWLNPPYGRGVGAWIQKAYEEAQNGLTVVCLIFARTDTKWWHDWAMKAHEIRLLRGRVRFQGAKASAPAPSCLLVFRGRQFRTNHPLVISQELPRS